MLGLLGRVLLIFIILRKINDIKIKNNDSIMTLKRDKFNKKSFKEAFPDINNENAFDIFEKILVFDPDKRASAEEILHILILKKIKINFAEYT